MSVGDHSCSTHEFLFHRWNLVQAADIAHNAGELNRLAAEFAELQQLVLNVTAKLALGQPLQSAD